MNNKTILSGCLIAMICLCGGCGSKGLADGASGNMESYESGEVNAITQAKPEVMILPSDGTLQNFNSLSKTVIDGQTVITRDYKNYLLKDDRAKRIYSTIQDAFQKQNFPLTDLEQSLKQLDSKAAYDMADDLQQDTKTILLNIARPDIILELDYNTSRDKKNVLSHDYTNSKSKDSEKNVSYTLSAIDSYTSKTVATITASNIKGTSTTETIQKDLADKLPGFMKDIQTYFSDILTRGRDITVRIVLGSDCDINLDEESVEDEPYSDFIIDYMKKHTVKGAYKMQTNTSTEMYFTNCRINLLNDDGSQYSVYDWARDFAKKMRGDLGLKVTNASQGLGEVELRIEGLK